MLTFANFRMPVNDAGTTEIYSFGGYSPPRRHRQRLPALRAATRATGRRSTRSASCRRSAARRPTTRRPAGSAGVVSGWNYELGAEFGHNDFDYNIDNTLNASLGPASTSPAPRDPTASWARPTIRAFPTRPTFFAGPGAARGVDRRRQRGPAGGDRTARAAQPRLRRRLPPGALRDPRGRAGVVHQRLPPGPGQRRPSRRAGSSGVPRLHAGQRDRAGPEQLRPLRRRRDRPHAQAAGERRRAVRELQRLRRAALAARWRSATSPRGG